MEYFLTFSNHLQSYLKTNLVFFIVYCNVGALENILGDEWGLHIQYVKQVYYLNLLVHIFGIQVLINVGFCFSEYLFYEC